MHSDRREALRATPWSALEVVPDGVHVFDLEGRLVFENRAAVAMLRWPEGALLGEAVHERVHPRRPDGSPWPCDDCPLHGAPGGDASCSLDDVAFTRADGATVRVAATRGPCRDAEGRVVGSIVTFRDLSAQLAARAEQETRERLLHDAQRIGQMGRWVYELSTGTLTWDEATCRLFGVDPAQSTGTLERFTAHLLPEDRGRVLSMLERVRHPREVIESEYRIRRADGALRWLRERGGVEVDAAGAVTRRLGMVIDVTEARFDAQLLSHETAVLEAISLGAPVREVLGRTLLGVEALLGEGLTSVMLVDEGGRLHLGAARNLPQAWLDGIEGEPAGPVAGSCGTAAYRKLPVVVTDIATDPLWAHYRDAALAHGLEACWSVPVLDVQGRVVATFAVYSREPRAPSDHELSTVTRFSHLVRLALQREARDAALRASELKFRRAFRDAAVGIAVCSLDGRYLEANEAYLEMLGYTDAELRALDYRELTHPEDRPRQRAMLEEILAGRSDGYVLEKRYLAKGGREVWGRVKVTAVRDEQGRPEVLIGVSEDLTRLKASEAWQQRFRELADAMPFVVWTATPDGAVDFISATLQRYAGQPERELVGQGWLALVHPEDLERAIADWASAMRDSAPYDSRFRLRRGGDGAWRWFHLRAVPSRDASGRVVKWYGSAADIDDVMRLEQEATALAARLTSTLESITDAFVTYDAEWRLTSLNHEAERLMQRPRAELLGRSLWELWPHLAGSVFEREYRRARVERRAVTFEYQSTQGGQWFEARAYPTAEGLASFTRDITERRRTEAMVREQAALLDLARDAMIVRDLEHRVLSWNPSAERLYGWRAEEVIGKSIAGQLYRDQSAYLAATRATLERGEWVGELQQQTRDGRALTVEARWTLVRDEGGAPRAIFAVNTDVTERKKLEAQLLRAQRLESIGTLAGGIAHDLNNVLSPILLSVDLLRRDPPVAPRDEVLDTIETSAQRGAEMVKQVLSFARGIDGPRGEVKPAELLQDLARVIGDTFPKNVRVETSLEPDAWSVVGDATQLHQVLLNLCVNARDAMPQGGRLRVSVENVMLDASYAAMNAEAREGAWVKLEVEDTGAGIPRDIIEHIFDPFFTTKEVGKGTGLGLSTSLGIVKGHGGFMRVYSEVGHGTRFRVYLPAGAVSASDSRPPVEGLAPRGQGQGVLVVDDEASIRQITRQTLEAFGYRVLVAANGAEAVATYAQQRDRVDVVLTDMAMPVMDGPATIHALRQLNPAVRIVGASGIGGNGKVSQAAGAGVKHFLTKPYTAETLLRALWRALVEEP
jgi:PAS domain S-box-containing protein